MVLKGMEGVHGTYRHGGGTWYLKAWRGYTVLKGMEGSTWYSKAWRGYMVLKGMEGVHGT